MNFFRDILRRALSITWRNKFLWVFGFFVALLGTGGELEVIFRDWSRYKDVSQTYNAVQDLYRSGFINFVFNNFKTFLVQYPVQTLLILLIFLAVIVFIIWFIVISQAGLIFNVKEMTEQKRASFNLGYRAGLKHFGNVLAFNIIAKLLVYVILFVFSLPLLAIFLKTDSKIITNIFFVLALFILIPLNIVISFIIRYAIFYLVKEERKFWDALRQGWKLFLKNWLLSIEMAALILLVGLAAGLMLVLVIIFVAAPFALIAFLTVVFNIKTALWVFVVICLIVVTLLIIIAGAVFSTFQYTAWILFFLALQEGKAKSKIVRLITAASHYFIKK